MGNGEANSSRRAAHLFVLRTYPSPKACTKLAETILVKAQAMIWYVNSNASGAQDGRTASTAFKTLAQAIEAAKRGDTILIAPGAYDQDLPGRLSAAHKAGIVVAVLGST
jgi:hypothetical protein